MGEIQKTYCDFNIVVSGCVSYLLQCHGTTDQTAMDWYTSLCLQTDIFGINVDQKRHQLPAMLHVYTCSDTISIKATVSVVTSCYRQVNHPDWCPDSSNVAVAPETASYYYLHTKSA